MAYERSRISKIKFVRRKEGIQLSKIYIKSSPVETQEEAGLMKTPFNVELDGNYIGIVTLGLFAIITEKKSSIKGTRYHVVVHIEQSETLKDFPFKHELKLNEFVGKTFKADHMILTETKGRTILTEDKHYKRKRKK